MIVIYGQRWYGSAFPHQGQGIATRGFHIYYVPLIPTGQMWIVSRGDRMVRGVTTRWSWRAALPIFAFQWAVVAAVALGASVPVIGIPAVIAAVGLGIWGYIGSHPNNARARAAREMTAGVLGTGCPPELMEGPMLRELAQRLDTTWAQVCPGRPPEDVASLGPRDRREAALAYTMLTVRASYERGALAKTLRQQADQVLDQLDRTPSLPQGAPYRAEVQLPEATGSPE
jgi:hypothetical protein